MTPAALQYLADLDAARDAGELSADDVARAKALLVDRGFGFTIPASVASDGSVFPSRVRAYLAKGAVGQGAVLPEQPPGGTVGVALSLLGWVTLVGGMLSALLIAVSFTTASEGQGLLGLSAFPLALSVAFWGAVTSAVLHGLAAIVHLLRRIDATLRRPG